MSRIKDYETIPKNVQAIQLVRNAISEIYEFINNKDCTFYFSNDKFSGTITDTFGTRLNFTGKDYLVKDSEGILSVWKPSEFEANFRLVIENTDT